MSESEKIDTTTRCSNGDKDDENEQCAYRDNPILFHDKTSLVFIKLNIQFGKASFHIPFLNY